MAYQKLQTNQAIQVIPDNNIIIPAPNEVASGTATGAATLKLIDSAANFSTTASVGDVIYSGSGAVRDAIATVTAVDSNTQLSVSVAIASGKNYNIYSKDLNEGCILYVGGQGDVVVETVAGNEVTFIGIQTGTFMPVQVLKVKTTTTATNIIAMW
jgi:hypothetical protein|tara:strand:+ start:78 stop:545 length:468 start_codon:yes stop_codon:yes gene_type:complete